MKLFVISLFGGALLLFTACKRQDQKLISQVEAEIQTRQNDLAHFESVGKSLEDFQAELEAAFPELENQPVDSLKLRANAMVNKERSALEAYKEGITNLGARLAEYQAGTAKKEALDLEYEVTNTSLGKMGKTFAILEDQERSMRQALAERRK